MKYVHAYLSIPTTVQEQISRSLNSELIDECGEVNTVSEHVAMMIPFYYIPLLLLLIVLVVKLSVKIKTRYWEHEERNVYHFVYSY